MSEHDTQQTLRSFSEYNLERGGQKAKLGLGLLAIDAWALAPLLALWFDRSLVTIIFAVSTIFLLIFLERHYRISPALAIRKLISIASGKQRYVRSYQKRRRRFTSGY